MFGWVSSVVKTVASEAQQFGHNCVESLVGEEEEDPTTTASTAAPSEASQNASDASPSEPKKDESSERQASSAADAADPQSDTNNRRKPRPEEESGGWAPSELRFVGRHTGKFAGWLVEKSAGVALSIIGDEDPTSTSSQETKKKNSEKDETLSDLAQHVREVSASDDRDGAAPTTTRSPHQNQNESPMALLRACRGYLGMLKKQQQQEEVGSKHSDNEILISLEVIETILNTSFPSEFDFNDDIDRDCSWIASTTAGERMENIRKSGSVTVDPSNGEPLHGERAIQSYDLLPRQCTTMCEAIVEILLSELAKLFARPDRQLTSTLHELLTARRHDGDQQHGEPERNAAKWYLHRRTDAHGVHLKLSHAEHVAKNVMDLVAFALCEMHRGCEAVCKVVQDAAAWARRSNHADAKAIKEHSMRTRGECLSANVNAVVLMEEGLEIIRAIFPTYEGVAPFEPLQVGAPMEFVQDPTVTVATEHGDTVVVASDRHEKQSKKKDD